MSLRVEFIEGLFDRLTLRYGSAFMDRWAGLRLAAVQEDWARGLASYAQRPEAVEHALSLLDPASPPTAADFWELCASAPAPAFRAQPEVKQPRRAAEVRRKYLRPVAPRVGRERAWAAEMVQRAAAGKRVSGYSLRVALEALERRPGSPF